MILEEFVSYYRKHKANKKAAKEVLLNWLKMELAKKPQKTYQRVLHNELEIINDECVIPKNREGETLLSSLLRVTEIIEEKEFETIASTMKSRDYLHA